MSQERHGLQDKPEHSSPQEQISTSQSLQYPAPPGLTDAWPSDLENSSKACPGCGAASNTDLRVLTKNPGFCCNKCAQSNSKEHGKLCTRNPVVQSFACDSYDRVMVSLNQNSKGFTPAPLMLIPDDDCPLAQHVVYNIAEAAGDEETTDVVEELSALFMWGTVKDKDVPRHWAEEKPDPTRRLQTVLELLKEQRDLHIVRLQGRHDARLRGG